jgi:uncharacterized protein (TIGR03085 family)
MDSLARTERRALADLFIEVGPDAPTLDEGWLTRDLAAHLVVRERRFDAGLKVLVKALEPWSDRVQAGYAARPWPELVEMFRRGPGGLSPLRIPAVDRLLNTGELFIHHEDVRRARPGWAPRDLPPKVQDALWKVVSGGAKLFMKGLPCPVTLRRPSGESVTIGGDGPGVTVTGEPAELALFTSGRQAHALVETDGDPALVAAVVGADFGT